MASAIDRLGPELAARVRHELQAGEEVVWASRPQRGAPAWFLAVAGLFGVIAIIVGILTLVFVVGVFFLAIGLLFIMLPRIQAGMLKRTAYALTDRRAIIVEPTMFGYRSTRSFGPAALGSVQRRDYPWRGQQLGDLIFTREVTGQGESTRSQEVGFIGIADARQVEELIRQVVDGQAVVRTAPTVAVGAPGV